ncbi:MAG: DsbA family protein [Bdellovibrionota bacterium]
MKSLILCLSFFSILAHAEKLIKRLDPKTVILESKNGPITLGDLNDPEPVIDKLEESLIDFYQKNAEQKLVERILEKKAKAKGLSNTEEYLKDFDASVKVSKKEIKEYIEKNKSKLEIFDPVKKFKRDMTDDEIKEQALNQKRQKERSVLLRKLISEAGIKQVLKKDPIEVPIGKQNPSQGPDKARVVLHAFSDFQCPYCAKVSVELKQLMNKHKKDLKVYFHHLPLSFHPLAKPAAIASFCAQEQGKFWQFHDAVFEKNSSLKAETFSEISKTLKLKQDEFEKCRLNPSTAQLIDEDSQKAQKLGIQSTPSFIVGGKKIAGFKSLADLESLTGLN